MSKTPDHSFKTILLKPFKNIPSIPSLFSMPNQVPQWIQSLSAVVSRIPVWLVFIVVVIPVLLKVLMQLTCYTIKPIEQFITENENEQEKKFKLELSNTESNVCNLITRVDSFIRNDIGHAGIENPSLITDAQTAARNGIDIVACNNGDTTENDNEIDHRLTRLEETLRSFTGVELQKTFQKTMTCEGFIGGESESEHKEKQTLPPSTEQKKRLSAIQELLAHQEQKLLLPIDQKTEDLKKGIVSDCDKKRAATHLSQLKKN